MTAPPEKPRFLGEYELLRPLMAGHQGLWMAADREVSELPRLSVIKLFSTPSAEATPAELARCTPQPIAGLAHRVLVQIFGQGEEQGHRYLAMEYVLGLDLGQLLRSGRERSEAPPLEVTLFLARELARALAHLHAHSDERLLHGRLAPAHVLWSYSGQVKLLSPQCQLPAGRSALQWSRTEESVTDYQAPELIAGQAVDERADVFGLGAVLWECLGGQRFTGVGRPDSTRERVLAGQLSLATLDPQLPPEVVALVGQALTIDPGARIESFVAFGTRLDELLERYAKGVGARAASDWLMSRFGREFEQRRHLQKALLGTRRGSSEYGPAAGQPEVDALIGTTLDDRYRVDQLVGEGGMGRVYEVEHVQLGKRLAVKVLHPAYSTDREVVERFRREARAASAIGHPNIVDVTDFGTTGDGRAYFVMELLDGMELADVVNQEGPLDFERAVDITIQICQAVGAAHQVGIIHRDLKPENVYLTTVGGRADVVKILDFGIAKGTRFEETRDRQLTEPGLAVGTPEYMAPEQAAGRPADPRFDVYAAGGILYAILTARPPYQGNNIMEILTRKATRNATPPRAFRPDLPLELERVILSAMARSPSQRPQRMDEMEYLLRKSLHGRADAVAHVLGISDALGEHSGGSAVGGTPAPLPSRRLPSAVTSPDAPATVTGRMQRTRDALADDTVVDGIDEPGFDSAEPLLLDLPDDRPAAAVRDDETTRIYHEPEPAFEASAEPEDSPEQPDPFLSRPALIAGGGLMGGVVLLLLLVWALWPPALSTRPPPPPAAPAAPAVLADPDAPDPDADPEGLAPLWKLDFAVAPRVVSATGLARLQARHAAAWVAYGQRALRAGRLFEPSGDCVQAGLQALGTLAPKSRGRARLRGRFFRKVIGGARRLRRKGALLKAETPLRQLLVIDAEDRRVRRELSLVIVAGGRRVLKEGKLEGAEALAGEAAKVAPEELAHRFLSIDVLLAREQYEQALAGYQAVLEKERRNAKAKRGIRALKKKLRKLDKGGSKKKKSRRRGRRRRRR